MLGVNLRGTFLVARAALGHMKAKRYGRFVFTSSITGPRVTSPGHGHYSASKAGINGFIKSAALEFSAYNITVNGVEPGNILTEGLEANRSKAFIRSMEEAIPLGRLGRLGTKRRFCLTATGTTILVDGGTLPEGKDFRLEPDDLDLKGAAAQSPLSIELTMSNPADKRKPAGTGIGSTRGAPGLAAPRPSPIPTPSRLRQTISSACGGPRRSKSSAARSACRRRSFRRGSIFRSAHCAIGSRGAKSRTRRPRLSRSDRAQPFGSRRGAAGEDVRLRLQFAWNETAEADQSLGPHALFSNSSRPISMRRISLVPAPIS